MSGLTKRRRPKKPTIVAKWSSLAKKSFYNKRSYKPLYEKVKGNNHALAKALSEEKQAYQSLVSENLALTSQVQELQVACSRRDDIISGILKNSKDSLGLIVTATNHITNTILSCQQFVNMPKFTPRKSTSSTDRRDSMQRLSGKSPARGVVQPMVGGHTITKPTINLSRLNLQREFRDRNRPNLSDIQESTTPTEQSPINRRSVSPAQVPVPRTLSCVSRRVERMPERIRRTLRTSDESPRRSSGRSVRNSIRHSRRQSPDSPDVRPARINNDESLRSPRVSLHDVSRLLHNAHSVNVRTLLDASSETDRVSPEPPLESPEVESQNSSTASGSRDPMEKSDGSLSSKTKREWSGRQDPEDPLEGPSWLLNNPEVASPAPSPTRKFCHSRYSDDDYINWDDGDMRTDSNLPMFVTRKRGSRCDDTEDFTLLWRKGPPKNYNYDPNELVFPVIESPIVKAPEVQMPEPEITANIQTAQTQNFDNLTFCRTTVVDPDDETRCIYPVAQASLMDNSEAFEPSPLSRRERPEELENDQESCLSRRKFHRIVPSRSPDNRAALATSPLAERSRSEDNMHRDSSPVQRKLHQKKSRLYVLESQSDSDWSPSPRLKKSRSKRKLKTKDPSSAKVVLLKLKDESITKCSISPERRQPDEDYRRKTGQSSTDPDPSMDARSIVSNASSASPTANTNVRGRQRRQKAPTNLQEPSLGKKLRRD